MILPKVLFWGVRGNLFSPINSQNSPHNMMPTTFNDSFKLFPYRKDYSNGRTNNGGIDLTVEPWRISEVTEAKDFPALRELIEEFNKPETPFVTLGCEAGVEEEVVHGYIEFSFKNDCVANDVEFISTLDEAFYSWVSGKSKEMEEALRSVLVWEYSPFSYHGRSERTKVSIFFRAPSKDYAGQVLGTIQVYFLEYLIIRTSK
jgi:hypothetical protein